MIRRVLPVLAAVAVLAACDPLGRPSLESAFGARILDGQLHIWTGSTCHDVIGLGLTFDPYKQDARTELMMTAPNRVGVVVDHFALGEPVPGLTVTQPLPPGFDWRSAEAVRINVDGIKTGGWGDTTELAEVIKNSAAHPDDTFWFQGVGWLNPEQVAREDGKTFLATCTPDAPK